MGGLLQIWAIPAAVFNHWGDDVAISDRTDVYQIYCTPESMTFNERLITSNSANRYKTRLTGFIPKDTVENQAAISFIEKRRWVIVFMDGNGNVKVAGTRSEPLNASFSFDSKSQTSERAGYSMSFHGNVNTRAAHVNNPF